MPYTPAEKDKIIREVCPHCAKGYEVRFRPETREWVHDLGTSTPDGRTHHVKHTLCLASNFRQGNLSGGMGG